MRNLLVALKSRGEAARLAAAAAAVAGPEARASVVHVIETGSVGDVVEAHLALAWTVDLLRSRGITAHGHADLMGHGDVVARLAERARASVADVVVMGSRGLGEVRGLTAGSVSHGLLATLELPILVLPDGARAPVRGLRRVVAAVGGEDDAGALVSAVRRLLGPATEVLAVHVPRRVALHAGAGAGATFAEIGETSSAVLATAVAQFEEAGLHADALTVERDGGVAATICEAARAWHADAIVLGTRRPGAWEALVAGSTLHRVLHHSDRPVLVAGRPSR